MYIDKRDFDVSRYQQLLEDLPGELIEDPDQDSDQDPNQDQDKD